MTASTTLPTNQPTAADALPDPVREALRMISGGVDNTETYNVLPVEVLQQVVALLPRVANTLTRMGVLYDPVEHADAALLAAICAGYARVDRGRRGAAAALEADRPAWLLRQRALYYKLVELGHAGPYAPNTVPTWAHSLVAMHWARNLPVEDSPIPLRMITPLPLPLPGTWELDRIVALHPVSQGPFGGPWAEVVRVERGGVAVGYLLRDHDVPGSQHQRGLWRACVGDDDHPLSCTELLDSDADGEPPAMQWADQQDALDALLAAAPVEES